MTTTSSSSTSSITVAVLQMQCNDTGNKEINQKSFRALVEDACNNKTPRPQLLLGPECAICGYTYDRQTCWNSAEPQNGPTEQFLTKLAQEFQVYIGISYLEVRYFENEAHVLNTFVLAGRNGKIQGRVSKATPCSVEAYFFRGPPNDNTSSSHVIECNNGWRVGVLICYENYVHDTMMILQQQKQPLDLLLQPFSGVLCDDSKPELKESLRQMYLEACPNNSQYFTCPALYCNKVGPWKQPSPTSLLPMTFDTEFPGCSTICDASGKILCRLDSTNVGVGSATITLGGAGGDDNHRTIPRYWGGYTHPSPFLKICTIFETLGSWSYNSSQERKQIAQTILVANNGVIQQQLEEKDPAAIKNEQNYSTRWNGCL